MKPATNAWLAASVIWPRACAGALPIACFDPPEAIASASSPTLLAAWRGSGSSDSFDSTRAWKIAPSAAMPVAMPTWRNVVLMPDAMPLCCGRTTPIAVEASGGLIRPIPMPDRMKPPSSVVHSESTLTPCISSRPPATSRSPPAMKYRTGTWSLRRPEIAAAKNDSSDSGRNRRPVSNAVKSSTFCM